MDTAFVLNPLMQLCLRAAEGYARTSSLRGEASTLKS